MTHTQGKWEASGCTIYSGENILATTYCEGNRSLHSNLQDKDTPPDSDGKHGHGWEEAWRNAELIAAAPELLEALQMLMPQEPRETDSYDAAMWQNARNAIDNATGRTNA